MQGVVGCIKGVHTMIIGVRAGGAGGGGGAAAPPVSEKFGQNAQNSGNEETINK